MSKEIMQQALDALINSRDTVWNVYQTDWRHGLPTRLSQMFAMEKECKDHDAAIAAIEAELAKKQTPDELLRQSEREGWGYSKELEHEIKRLEAELAKPEQPQTDLRKAAEMALEAIKNGKLVREGEGGTQYQPDLEEKAVEALRQALAQSEQMSEPIYLSGQYVGEGKVVSIKTGLPDGAIQEACHMAKLAQPEQESVALKQLRDLHKVQGSKGCYDVNEYMCGLYNGLELALSLFENRDPAYKETHFEQEALDKKADNARELGLDYEPEQKPVAWDGWILREVYFEGESPCGHREPPKREWQGLTDEEIKNVWQEIKDAVCLDHQTFARAIEAKLREKNT